MVLAPWLVDSLSLVASGAASNWWGLACPAHCRGVGAGELCAAFLLGVLVTVLGGLAVWTWLTLRTALPASAPAPARASASRLRGYVNGRAGLSL